MLSVSQILHHRFCNGLPKAIPAKSLNRTWPALPLEIRIVTSHKSFCSSGPYRNRIPSLACPFSSQFFHSLIQSCRFISLLLMIGSVARYSRMIQMILNRLDADVDIYFLKFMLFFRKLSTSTKLGHIPNARHIVTIL